MEKSIIDEIKDRILSQYHPNKLYLFGSAALKGPALANDIDLCVIKEDINNKSEEFIKLRKILGRTIMPLDILFFTKDEFDRRKNIWGTVHYEIDKKGKILYDAGR